MSIQDKLGKAAYLAFLGAMNDNGGRLTWENLDPDLKVVWVKAAEAAVEADARDTVMRDTNHLFCAQHFNLAERGEIKKLDECILCIRDQRDQLLGVCKFVASSFEDRCGDHCRNNCPGCAARSLVEDLARPK